MPMLGPVAIQSPNGTLSWCRIELNDQGEVQALHLAPTTGEGMMPAPEEYTITNADFPTPLCVLDDPSKPSGIRPYCFVIETNKLYRFHSIPCGTTQRVIGERVSAPNRYQTIQGKESNALQSNIDHAFITNDQTAAFDEIRAALQRQYHDKNQLRVDFLTADMPPNTWLLNNHQRGVCRQSEFYYHWLALKQNSRSQTDYCSSLMAVLNNNNTADWIPDPEQKDARETEIRLLRAALQPDRINPLNAFYAGEARPLDDQPRLGDVHAFMIQLLIQELSLYSPVPFEGRKPKLTPLQYDFMVGDYSTPLADAHVDAYGNDNQSNATLIIQALNNPDIQDDQRSLEHKIKLISDIKNSLLDECAGRRAPFQKALSSSKCNSA